MATATVLTRTISGVSAGTGASCLIASWPGPLAMTAVWLDGTGVEIAGMSSKGISRGLGKRHEGKWRLSYLDAM